MKKKLLALVLVATMIVSVLTGCGGGKSKTMTVSEMLDAVLEANGGEMLIYTYDDYELGVGKDSRVNTFYYNGDIGDYASFKQGSNGVKPKLGEIAQDNLSAYSFEVGLDEPESLGLHLITDSTGNAVDHEALYYTVSGSNKDLIKFGGIFERLEIYDKTFMLFRYDYYNRSHQKIKYMYVIIPDVEATKNKTIIFDEIGTEGILVD